MTALADRRAGLSSPPRAMPSVGRLTAKQLAWCRDNLKGWADLARECGQPVPDKEC